MQVEQLPKTARIIILWGGTIGVAILLFIWFVWHTKNSLQESSGADIGGELQLESLEEQIQLTPIGNNF